MNTEATGAHVNTPHQDERPMKGAEWLKVNGRDVTADEPVFVGSETYLAGERISCGRMTSIPDIPPVDGNIYTGSATIRISVENMPPVLAARILNLLDGAVSILRGGSSPGILAEGWRHIDRKEVDGDQLPPSVASGAPEPGQALPPS